MGDLEPKRVEGDPGTNKLFPVGDKAISKTLSRIVSYADHTYFTNNIVRPRLKSRNENLDAFFEWSAGFYQMKTRGVGVEERDHFMKGTLFVYSALTNQAEDQIPIITFTNEQDDIKDMFGKELAKITEFAHAHGTDMNTDYALEEIAQARISQLAKESEGDQALGEALIKYVTNYPRGGNAFLVGAMFAYFPLKRRYLEIEEEKARQNAERQQQQHESISIQSTNTAIRRLDNEHPELDDLNEEFDLSWNVEVGTEPTKVDVFARRNALDTTDLGVDFDLGLGELEKFLREQGQSNQ